MLPCYLCTKVKYKCNKYVTSPCCTVVSFTFYCPYNLHWLAWNAKYRTKKKHVKSSDQRKIYTRTRDTRLLIVNTSVLQSSHIFSKKQATSLCNYKLQVFFIRNKVNIGDQWQWFICNCVHSIKEKNQRQIEEPVLNLWLQPGPDFLSLWL